MTMPPLTAATAKIPFFLRAAKQPAAILTGLGRDRKVFYNHFGKIRSILNSNEFVLLGGNALTLTGGNVTRINFPAPVETMIEGYFLLSNHDLIARNGQVQMSDVTAVWKNGSTFYFAKGSVLYKNFVEFVRLDPQDSITNCSEGRLEQDMETPGVERVKYSPILIVNGRAMHACSVSSVNGVSAFGWTYDTPEGFVAEGCCGEISEGESAYVWGRSGDTPRFYKLTGQDGGGVTDGTTKTMYLTCQSTATDGHWLGSFYIDSDHKFRDPGGSTMPLSGAAHNININAAAGTWRFYPYRDHGWIGNVYSASTGYVRGAHLYVETLLDSSTVRCAELGILDVLGNFRLKIIQ